MKNAGAVLLPSQQLADLSEQFAICLSGKTSPKNCDIRYRQLYWLLVFDKQGALRHACRLGDELTKVTKKGFDVPNAFVEIVEDAIARPASLPALQRAYVAERGGTKAFDALQAKLKELHGVGQMHVAAFLNEVADETADPVLSRARALQVEADACSHQVINHGAFAHLRTGVATFLQAHPEHPSAERLLAPLLEVGMKYSFDVRAKCRDLAQRLTAGEATTAHRKLADLLLKRSAELVVKAEKERQAMKPSDYGYLRLLAVVGDAEATLAKLQATKTFGVFRPIHKEWRQQATAKAAGSGKAGK